jgi:hypothetical protein
MFGEVSEVNGALSPMHLIYTDQRVMGRSVDTLQTGTIVVVKNLL